jgi:hypothetical protein
MGGGDQECIIVLVGKPEETWGVRVLIGFNWLRIGSTPGLMNTVVNSWVS